MKLIYALALQILNGGDRLPDNEREDAERAFIRFYMDEEQVNIY